MEQVYVLDVDGENYSEFIDSGLVALHFFSESEMDCLMSLPVLDVLAEEYGERMRFGKVDIYEFEDIAERHGVSSVPTMIILKNGEQVERIHDAFSEEILRERICLLI